MGLGILEVLGVILITLKLFGLVTISWPLALAPLWIPLVLVGILMILACLFGTD
jgi:hypothetical protein